MSDRERGPDASTWSWRAPLVVAAAGLTAAAGVAASGGVDLTAGVEIFAYSVAAATVAGAVALLLPIVARRRSLAVIAAASALAPLLAAGVAVALAAHEMFLAPHDVVVVSVVLITSTTLGLLIALVVGARVSDASRTITAMARRLADGGTGLGPHPDPGGPDELVHLADELETTAARLRCARASAEDAEDSRRNLVAWVSHDLRTPLAGIRAMVEAIEDGVVADDATVSRYHATIRVEVDRIAALVDDLFELSRIEAGTLRVDSEWVPLDELVSDTIDASRAAARSVELATLMSCRSVVLMSAPEIIRVVRNLVDNAVRHTPAGQRVLVEVGTTGPTAWIAVSDGCGGIPDDELDRVFEPGFRGDTARTPTGRSGLGLAVAKGLVEAHGGGIEVHNTPSGCCFRIVFPEQRCRIGPTLPIDRRHRVDDPAPARAERQPRRAASSSQP